MASGSWMCSIVCRNTTQSTSPARARPRALEGDPPLLGAGVLEGLGSASTPTTDAAVAPAPPSRSPRRRRDRRRGGRARVRDPLVDDEVAPVPVVFLRDVGQRALARQVQRRHPVRLVTLDVELLVIRSPASSTESQEPEQPPSRRRPARAAVCRASSTTSRRLAAAARQLRARDRAPNRSGRRRRARPGGSCDGERLVRVGSKQQHVQLPSSARRASVQAPGLVRAARAPGAASARAPRSASRGARRASLTRPAHRRCRPRRSTTPRPRRAIWKDTERQVVRGRAPACHGIGSRSPTSSATPSSSTRTTPAPAADGALPRCSAWTNCPGPRPSSWRRTTAADRSIVDQWLGAAWPPSTLALTRRPPAMKRAGH